MPGDLRLVASPLRVRTVPGDSGGFRWVVVLPGPPPRLLVAGQRVYTTEAEAREAGQRVATAYATELETD